MCRGPNPNLLILQLSVHFIPRHALHQLPSMMQWFTQSLRTPRIHHCYMYRFHITQFHPYAILCNTIISSYIISICEPTVTHKTSPGGNCKTAVISLCASENRCSLCVYMPALHEETHESRFSVLCPL